MRGSVGHADEWSFRFMAAYHHRSCVAACSLRLVVVLELKDYKIAWLK